MKCIFCLDEKPPSDEHVIPESIGGTLRIQEVCGDCNSELNRLIDNPFSNCFLIQLARFTYSLGGKRDVVPFPFGALGTFDTGQKVRLDREFTPRPMRTFEVNPLTDGQLEVRFSADVADRGNLENMLGKPLRKRLQAEAPGSDPKKVDDLISKIVASASAQNASSGQEWIKIPFQVRPRALLGEFIKIAYELWFKTFGLSWVKSSPTARIMREFLFARNATMQLRGQLPCQPMPLPLSDPDKNHAVLLMDGVCVIRLFNIWCAVQCEASTKDFMLTEQTSRIILQDFLTGSVLDEELPDFLARNLPGA
jgi:hypothetical protein